MTNLALEIVVLTVLLVNFGAILSANIYDSSKRALQRRKLYIVRILLVILTA